MPRCSLVERTKSSTSDLRKNRWNASCCRIYARRANTLCCSRCRFEPVPRVPPTYESGPLICIVPGAEVDRETAEVSGGSRRTRSYAKRELRDDTDYIRNFLLAVYVNSAQRSRSFIPDKSGNLCQSVKSYVRRGKNSLAEADGTYRLSTLIPLNKQADNLTRGFDTRS